MGGVLFRMFNHGVLLGLAVMAPEDAENSPGVDTLHVCFVLHPHSLADGWLLFAMPSRALSHYNLEHLLQVAAKTPLLAHYDVPAEFRAVLSKFAHTACDASYNSKLVIQSMDIDHERCSAVKV